jgi:thiol:disulfide interchange protein
MTHSRLLAAAGTVLMALTTVLTAIPARAQDASVGITKRQIYPPIDSAAADITAALDEARASHKRVIVDFGGDWCPDCQVLNIYFHQSPNAELLGKYFVRVNINVGRMDANQDIAAKYGVPLKGVPALAVLDGDGKVVYAQNKEFSDMRHMDSSALTAFLNQWKP